LLYSTANGLSMPERYGYPEQSLSQVLISIESCVKHVSVFKEKVGEIYTNFIRHVSLSLWLNFVKVLKSFSNIEIVA
jgi:hypothetical protein